MEGRRRRANYLTYAYAYPIYTGYYGEAVLLEELAGGWGTSPTSPTPSCWHLPPAPTQSAYFINFLGGETVSHSPNRQGP